MRMLGWGNCLHEVLRRPELAGSVRPPLVPFPPTPFFHWLLEVLPSALRASPRSGCGALVHPDSPPYVRDGARAFFAGRSDLVIERATRRLHRAPTS